MLEPTTKLKLTTKNGMSLTSFESYAQAHFYATYTENLKLFRDNPEFQQSSKWGFLSLWPKRVAEVIHMMRRGYDEEFFLNAWNRQFPVVEICKGDAQNVQRILVRGNVSIEALLKDWCKAYFDAYGLDLSEFESDAKAHQHAIDRENKLLSARPEFRQSSKWGFLFLFPERVAEAIHIARRGYNEEFFLDAWEQQFPLVEMAEGDSQNVRRLLIGRTMNLDALLEDWCKDYFYNHGMDLSEEEG